MIKHVPDALRDVILPFDWDVEKIWELHAPTRVFPRAQFDSLLDLPLWSSESGRGMLFDLRPISVITDPACSVYQAERLARIDTSHPIDLLEFDGRKWILDGVHRLARHYLDGTTEIEARVHDACVIEHIRAGGV